MEEKNNKLSIPSAIVLAGLVIAVGIIISNAKPSTEDNNIVYANSSKISFEPLNESDHIIGGLSSPVIILEYSDTECPYCKNFQTYMQKVVSTYESGKVAWVYRHSPIDALHQKSRKEAEATECVNELGGNSAFWTMLDAIYANTPSNDGLEAFKTSTTCKNPALMLNNLLPVLQAENMLPKLNLVFKTSAKAGANGTPYSLLILKEKLTDQRKKILKFVSSKRTYI
jgi:hypothetical protein